MVESEMDRRDLDRKPLDVYLNKFIGDEPYMVRTSDISPSGIYLHKLIEPDLPEGSVVSLEFQLPNSDEIIWARGAVMREGLFWGTNGVGLWFTHLPGAYRRLIEEYVSLN